MRGRVIFYGHEAVYQKAEMADHGKNHAQDIIYLFQQCIYLSIHLQQKNYVNMCVHIGYII